MGRVGMGTNSTLPAPASYTLSVDSKRRPTFPAQLLADADIGADELLVAHAEGQGRIILETRAAVKRRVQQRFRSAAQAAGRTNLVDELNEERAVDTSLHP